MTFSISYQDTYYVYESLRELKTNINKLLQTNEVTAIQKVHLRSYMRTLKRRMAKMEVNLRMEMVIEIEPRPEYVEIGEAC